MLTYRSAAGRGPATLSPPARLLSRPPPARQQPGNHLRLARLAHRPTAARQALDGLVQDRRVVVPVLLRRIGGAAVQRDEALHESAPVRAAAHASPAASVASQAAAASRSRL